MHAITICQKRKVKCVDSAQHFLNFPYPTSPGPQCVRRWWQVPSMRVRGEQYSIKEIHERSFILNKLSSFCTQNIWNTYDNLCLKTVHLIQKCLSRVGVGRVSFKKIKDVPHPIVINLGQRSFTFLVSIFSSGHNRYKPYQSGVAVGDVV